MAAASQQHTASPLDALDLGHPQLSLNQGFVLHEKPGPGARSEIVELLQNMPFLVRLIHLKRHN